MLSTQGPGERRHLVRVAAGQCHRPQHHHQLHHPLLVAVVAREQQEVDGEVDLLGELERVVCKDLEEVEQREEAAEQRLGE